MHDEYTRKKLHIGTSGWSYRHWQDSFYPRGVMPRYWLAFYAEHFSTVEINNSFYRLPERETFANWSTATPDDFTFAVKASRYITQFKKLSGTEDAVRRVLDNARGLGTKLGPILFQLPANWHLNLERFADFTASLPPGYQYAFEFRHDSWLCGDVYRLLRDKGLAFCISDAPSWSTSLETTAPFAYIRLHGGRVLYGSEYSEGELNKWARLIEQFAEQQLEVFVYFNNDAQGYAVKNALRLKNILGA